ncbi:MAG: HAD family phosphatase [Methanomassiliicoccales archaeon]
MSAKRKYDLVAFDMDGVLVDYRSCWTWIHDHFSVDNERSLELFVRGEIDDLEFMRRDIALWKAKHPTLCRDDLRSILEPLPMSEGIAETVSRLKESGVRTVIISGGIDLVAERIARRYGFDDYFANGVECDEKGLLTGEGILRVQLKNKRAALESCMAKFNVPRERTAAIGDSFIDVSMFEAAGMSIAYNPSDEVVRRSATYVVEGGSLTAILPYILDGHE